MAAEAAESRVLPCDAKKFFHGTLTRKRMIAILWGGRRGREEELSADEDEKKECFYCTGSIGWVTIAAFLTHGEGHPFEYDTCARGRRSLRCEDADDEYSTCKEKALSAKRMHVIG